MPENDIPTITLNNGDEVSIDEYGKILDYLKAACADKKELSENLFGLSDFSGEKGLYSICALYAKEALGCADDPDLKAKCYLRLGQLKEKDEEYGDAIWYYSEAFTLEPGKDSTWYLLYNNLGYCLNAVGRHKEAEYYCREAIGIDAKRYNAFKNLGLSLQGQKRYVEAAWMLIHAAQICPEDPRAMHHLRDLFVTYRGAVKEDPALLAHMVALEKFVESDKPGTVH